MMDVASIEVGLRYRADMGDLQRLADSIADIGLLQPIVVTPDRKLIAGERRLRACSEILGWQEIPTRIVEIDSIARGEHDENEVRKDFTPSERVSIVAAIRTTGRAGRPDNSQNIGNKVTVPEAAKVAGFGNEETYRQARTVVERGIPELVEAMDSGEIAISKAAEIARAEPEVQQAAIVNRTSFTGNNEWYTPAEYIEHARSVIGEFDLDPASSEIANAAVRAKAFYTEDEDGLSLSWHGSVWLNPPYAQPAIGQFIEKAIHEFGSGAVDRMIVLTHNYTDTRWFQAAAQAADAICFTKGRIRFESPTGEKAAPTQGQAFFYFGDDINQFHAVFSDIGLVVQVLK